MKNEDSFWNRNSWKLVALCLIVIVTMISVSVAHAAGASATVSWTHPVANTDGSALALSDIKETVITWRRPGSLTIAGSVRIAAPAATTVVPGLVCGNFEFLAATVTKANAQSADSAAAPYATGVVCTPNPPTGLTVS